jgi:hypothetical protein
MQIQQNDLEYLKDKLNTGMMTAAQANVEKVRMQRVRLVTSRLPAEVRKALNEAVKRGELGHFAKADRKPEAYFHPAFEYLAKAERNEHERSTLKALLAVCV